MENSTKAFYMAAGALIGIMILTAFALVFSKGGQVLSTIDNKEISRQIEEYNAKLIIYNRNNNTIFDVVTACNLAYDINNQNIFDNHNCLKIDLQLEDEEEYTLQNSDQQEKGFIGILPNRKRLTSLIEDYGETIEGTFEYKYTFECLEIKNDDQTGKINYIKFKLNNP